MLGTAHINTSKYIGLREYLSKQTVIKTTSAQEVAQGCSMATFDSHLTTISSRFRGSEKILVC